jgi:predicted PurR-regulated permease PerM
MENIITFVIGVLSTIFLFGIVYGIKILISFKKESDEYLNELEDFQENFNDTERELNLEIDKLNKRLDSAIEERNNIIEGLTKYIDAQPEKIINVIEQSVGSRLEEIEDDIEELLNSEENE